MIGLFQMNDDQIVDWLLDQCGMKATAKLEMYPGTTKLKRIEVPVDQVEADINEQGMMVLRQKDQEVFRKPVWTVLSV